MMLARVSATVAIFGTSLLVASAQTPTYTIKIKSEVDVGKTVTKSDITTDARPSKILDVEGKVLAELPLLSKKLEYDYTVLSRDKDGSGKTKSTYEKAQDNSSGKMGKLSYEGRMLISQRKDGVVRIGVVGKPPLADKDIQDLLKKANDRKTKSEEDRAMLPGKAVAIGEEWDIDSKAVAALMQGFVLEEKSSKCSGKLVKVYSKGKSQLGVLDFHFKLATKRTGEGITFDDPLIFDVTMTVETAIDGSSTFRIEESSTTIKGKGTFTVGEEKRSINFDTVLKGKVETSEERDEPKALVVPEVELIGPGQWTAYSSKEGKFAASFPAKPKVDTKKDAKKDTTTTVSATLDNGNIYYAVSFTDYAAGDPTTDPKVVLKAIVDNFKEGTTESKDIEVGGNAGVHLVREIEKDKVKMTLYYRAFYVEGRLYQAMVVCPKDSKDKVDPKKFFESFKFVVEKKAN